MTEAVRRIHLTIAGLVQGVGFRPFVYNLARRYALTGWVLNNARGVVIEAEGPFAAVAAFAAALREECPPLARMDEFVLTEVDPAGDAVFVIRPSEGSPAPTALVSPDAATCPDCRRELADPDDRRFGYPFINCTNCGPRYTIITNMPYDRPHTTMAGFPMCPECRAEYSDPADRRFHAQPNACPVCGPVCRLLAPDGTETAGEPVAAARALVMDGAIAAVKGVGGYHLACNARDGAAVARLRSRKVREEKPFAVMCGGMEAVRALCRVSPEEEELLLSSARPIVLLEKRPDYALADDVAPGNPWLGVMLPYTPLHWLLLEPDDAWVMTSGNVSDEPVVFDDDEALARLAGIADCFLVHNRSIHCRADDSVVRVFDGVPYFVRRGRGHVPAPVRLDGPMPPVLACGGELKNTFCLTRGDLAFVSAHVGDLENLPTYNAYVEMIAHYQRLLSVRPEVAAYDLHPEYLSAKYALALGLPGIAVQHHHAHVAAVMAEHGIREKVVGVAFDGVGFGTDGRLWGGEFLVADRRDFARAAHLSYIPLPGGAAAIREPWRVAAWLLNDIYGPETARYEIPFVRSLPPGWELAVAAANKGLNAPLSSGAGRLFDAAAAVLGIRMAVNYEGQAAIELERSAAGVRAAAPLPYDLIPGDPVRIDFRPAFAAMTEGLRAGRRVAELAAAFHAAMASMIVDVAARVAQPAGISRVVLTGGVFQNVTLLRQAVDGLRARGLTPMTHRWTPPNDGGLSLGQAAVAGERSK